MSGTLTATASSGIATFSGLSIDKVGTGYTLSATSGSLTSTTSSAFNITPGAAKPVISGVNNICITSSSKLFASTAPSQNPWISTNETIAKVSNTGIITALKIGTTNIIYTDTFGLRDTFLVNVVSAVKPQINYSALNLTKNGTISLKSTSASKYLWSSGDTTQGVNISQAGKYYVKIEDSNRCSAVSDTVIIYPPSPDIKIDTISLIIGGLNNPIDISQYFNTTSPNCKIKYFDQNKSVLSKAPTIPSSVGIFKYYVAQEENSILSSYKPFILVMVDPIKMLQLEMFTLKEATLQEDASFVVGVRIRLTNSTSDTIRSLSIINNMFSVFPSGSNFKIISMKSSGLIITNNTYDGNIIIEMLNNSSKIPGNKSDSIDLQIKIYPNGFAGDINLQAYQTSISQFGVFITKSFDSKKSNVQTSEGTPTVINIPKINFTIPSGFSPNGDGFNDRYVIIKPHNTSIDLQVYDRTGAMVYKSTDYKNDWDGRSNQGNSIFGRELPAGTYYYIVKISDKLTGKVNNISGYISIRR